MKESKGMKALAYTTLTIISVLAVLPLLLLFIGSFTDNATAIANGYSYFPAKWSAEAYKYIADQWTLVGKGYANTILVTVVGTALSLIMTSMFGYGLTVRDLPGKKVLTVMVIISMLFNGGIVATYFIYSNIVIVGNPINIKRIVDALREMQYIMKEIARQLQSGDFPLSGSAYQEMKKDYLAMAITVVDIVNGAAYMFDKSPDADNQHWKADLELEQLREALHLEDPTDSGQRR